MNRYEKIAKMEKIRVKHEEILENMSNLLALLESQVEEYKELIEYYYSKEREKDIEDDNKGLIPKEIKRGVLSEDEIFNLMGDYYDISIRMLELSTKILKN